MFDILVSFSDHKLTYLLYDFLLRKKNKKITWTEKQIEKMQAEEHSAEMLIYNSVYKCG